MSVNKILIDRRNYETMIPQLRDELSKVDLAGFDIETEDSKKHPGLKRTKRLVIDYRRSIITGISVYPDAGPNVYYLNLAHLDVENRLPPEVVEELFNPYLARAAVVIHNAPYELAQFQNSPFKLNFNITNTICTMQMAVSAYGSDQYDPQALVQAGLGPMKPLLIKSIKEFATYQGGPMNPEQSKIFSQLIAKESHADHSYNGLVESICYGYGLKQAIMSWFGIKMATFQETVGDKEHMGNLTGEEVLSYGADDAYWCMRLYHRLFEYMIATNPKVITTFFTQEMPMVFVYAQTKVDGLRIDPVKVQDRRQDERHNYAVILRKLKAEVRKLLPFKPEVNPFLFLNEVWYTKNAAGYRKKISDWALSPDSDDDFIQCGQISGPVPSAWIEERLAAGSKVPKTKNLNLTHYMPMRTLMYDLLGTKPIMDKGKLQSDGEARQRVQQRLEKQIKKLTESATDTTTVKAALEVMRYINELGSIDQRMKLYLNPYVNLIDPETGRVYPTITSMLATRRLAGSDPNGMQLAKRGSSTYVRGFYEADETPDWDEDEEFLVSLDWSQIELVLIGEFSGDPEFAKAYGQTPYNDLHIGATANALSVMIPKLTEEKFRLMKVMTAEQVCDELDESLLRTTNGEIMTPAKAYGYWRTEVGKGANFNYWYSGALSTVGQRLGWSSDQMWAATERYRERFAVAEAWRVNTINELKATGVVALPDHHTRVRMEATQFWKDLMMQRFNDVAHSAMSPGISYLGREFVKKVSNRAGNQGINAKVQGTCATLLKRSIPKINSEIKGMGIRGRFKMPVHDEVVYSIHRRDVGAFIPMAKSVMKSHPEIISNLVIDCTASVGATFEPWNPKVPYGQIELDEAPPLSFIPANMVGKPLPPEMIEEVVKYLSERK
jgi:DNA polymerase I-like protein with 3'-5' exonuclease and polymerase domains